MKELTLEILEKALEDWKKPISQCKENYTNHGLCYYFKIVHNIDYYGISRLEVPWAKQVTYNGFFLHFNGIGGEEQGRAERINSIKGMIKDLKEKQTK